MENASKALLMAGGVLLGIMILSLAVYLFSNFGSTSSTIHENIETNQISQFNSQLMQYDGNQTVTMYHVVSMARLATQNNQNYEFAHRAPAEVTDKDMYISVICQNSSIELGYNKTQTAEQRKNQVETHFNDLISNELNFVTENGLPKYDVQVYISDITKRVYKVVCIKKT